MQTKTKHFLNAILVAIFTTFVCCAVFLFGGLVKPEEVASPEQPKVQNTLTLESDFSNNKYVIVGGKVYLYNQPQSQTTGLSETDIAISFDANNKLELIFIEDSVSTLSSFAVSEEKIVSILTAEKTSENINITITDKYDEVEITTSHDAEYVLGELVLVSKNRLTFEDEAFKLNQKPTTSFTATADDTAKVVSISEGTMGLGGSKTYSPKSGETCRAVYQSGGELTLTGITLTGFSVTGSGGAIYQDAGILNLNCTITGCSASAKGGAVYSEETLNVTGGTVSNNTAGAGGGAFCKNGGTATFATVTVQDNITTTSYGHAIYADGGATVNVNSGTYATQNSSYPAATVIVGTATMNLSGGTLKGYNYVFDCFTAAAANANYTLKGNLTLEATSGNHFWLSVGTYLRVETSLTKSYTVLKSGVTSIDDGDAATSYIAYSATASYLATAKSNLIVTNYSSVHQHSTAMKTNYLVCEYKSYGKVLSFNDNLGDASGFTQYNAGEYLDTGIKTDWDKDFTFSLKFKVATVGNRYMLASSYNGSNHFAIELTTQNYLRLYLNNGAVDTSITTAVPVNTTIQVTFKWEAASNKWTISGSGTGYSQSKTGTYDMSGAGSYTIRLGALDYRGSVVFSAITVGNFVYTRYQKYKTVVGTLETPSNTGYVFDGWYTAASGGSKYSSSTTLPENGITYSAHWSCQPYYLAINPDNTTDEYYNETTYGAYIETAGTFDGNDFKTVSRSYMFTDKITINVWANMSSWSDYTKGMRIYSCTEGGGWNLESANGNIQFACYDSGVGYKVVNANKAWSSLAAGWHMFTMTFDGTNVRAYIDGTLYGTSSVYTSGKIGYHTSNGIFIGAEATSNTTTPDGSYFSGNIQDFTIVNDCFVAGEISNIYAAGRGKIIVSKDFLETYTLDNPTRTGYTFQSWTQTGSGDIEVGQGASSQSGFTRTNNTYHENFKFSVAKPSGNTWYSIRWPKYTFTAGHTYRLTYKIRVNTVTGTNFAVRFSRLSNDYFGCPTTTYSAATGGWVTGSMVQVLPTSFVYSSSTKTVDPLIEVYTADLKSGSTSTLVIDFDIKDIVVTDLTDNTIAFASDSSYLFKNGNGSATASWKANTYSVAFNGNGSTSGSMSNQTHTYDTSLALTANAYVKTGHTFKGWSTSSTATTATYTDKQSVKNLSSTQGATVTLYAVWQVNTYTLHLFKGQENLLSAAEMAKSSTVSGNNCTVAYSPVNGGKWTSTPANTSDPYATLSQTVYLTSGTQYYFHMTIRNTDGTVPTSGSMQLFIGPNGSYTEANSVRFQLGGGIATFTAPSTATYRLRLDNDYSGKQVVVTNLWVSSVSTTHYLTTTMTYGSSFDLVNPTRAGHSFSGWTVASGAYSINGTANSISGTSTISGTTLTMGAGNAFVFANFERYSYTVTISSSNTGYGTVSPGSVTGYYGAAVSTNGSTLTIGGSTITATPKTATAQYTYSFSSWSNVPTVISTAVTITANFARTVNKYTVTISSNNTGYGTVSKSSMSVNYGTAVSTSGATLTIGSTAITATPVAATAQYTYSFSSWSNVPTSITGAVTITANFTRTVNNYVVTIAVNSSTYGSVSTTSVTVPYGTTYSTSGATLTIGSYTSTASAKSVTGYTTSFSSWSSTSGTITAATTITANFSGTGISYTVRVSYNNGSSDSLTSKTYGTGFTVSNPTRTGHTFAGWSIRGMDSCTHYYGSSSSSYSTSTATSLTGIKSTWFKNLTSTAGATVTMSATWSINTYTIVVNYNYQYSMNDDATSYTVYYGDGWEITNPEDDWYRFTGWKITGMDSTTHDYGTGTNDYSSTTATSISSTKATWFRNLRITSGTVTFTAQWAKSSRTVTVKYNIDNAALLDVYDRVNYQRTYPYSFSYSGFTDSDLNPIISLYCDPEYNKFASVSISNIYTVESYRSADYDVYDVYVYNEDQDWGFYVSSWDDYQGSIRADHSYTITFMLETATKVNVKLVVNDSSNIGYYINHKNGTYDSPYTISVKVGTMITIEDQLITFGTENVWVITAGKTSWSVSSGSYVTAAMTITVTITAQTFTVSFMVNDSSLGTVSPTSVSATSGTTYTSSGATMTVGSTEVMAMPKLVSSTGVELTALIGSFATFSRWSPSSGTVTSDITITAYFSSPGGITPEIKLNVELGEVDQGCVSLTSAEEETPPENTVWLDDKFRKLQEQSETEVDFEGVSLL